MISRTNLKDLVELKLIETLQNTEKWKFLLLQICNETSSNRSFLLRLWLASEWNRLSKRGKKILDGDSIYCWLNGGKSECTLVVGCNNGVGFKPTWLNDWRSLVYVTREKCPFNRRLQGFFLLFFKLNACMDESFIIT